MIDHIASPSFDVNATHRFYVDVLGGRLKGAFAGESHDWNARFLLASYAIFGAELDFFSFEGIVRPPPDGLPHDIRHVGIAVPSATDLAGVRERVTSHGVAFWVEFHDGEHDEHLYVTDPNGLVVEFSIAAAPSPLDDNAIDLVRDWIADHPSAP